MSGAMDDPDLLAAEYVLGTLDAVTAQRVARQAETDPALRGAIAAWEQRLHPLSSLAAPATPPDALWQRLAVSIEAPAPAAGAPSAATGTAANGGAWMAPGQATAAQPSGSVVPLRRAWRSVALWRGATAASLALAAGLAAFIVLRAPPPQPVAALVPAGSAAAVYVAQLQPDGTLRVLALQNVAVAAGKDLELWALPPGAARPVSLGVLPAAGRGVAPPTLPGNGTQLLISLEPRGGSPTGQPTGPVLYSGTLHQT